MQNLRLIFISASFPILVYMVWFLGAHIRLQKLQKREYLFGTQYYHCLAKDVFASSLKTINIINVIESFSYLLSVLFYFPSILFQGKVRNVVIGSLTSNFSRIPWYCPEQNILYLFDSSYIFLLFHKYSM